MWGEPRPAHRQWGAFSLPGALPRTPLRRHRPPTTKRLLALGGCHLQDIRPRADFVGGRKITLELPADLTEKEAGGLEVSSRLWRYLLDVFRYRKSKE